jgi:hypothetical protein
MGQVVQKICSVCGEDVANQKRTKDSAGNYYCQPCYDDARARQNQPHASGESESSVRCASCGTRIEEDAAFCARCGAKQDGNLSTDEEIDVTTVVAYLRRYGELVHALERAADADRAYEEARPQMRAAGANAEVARLEAMYAQGVATKNANITECNELKAKLLAFDAERVGYIRDLFLQNEKVESSLKDGLRRDSFGIFKPTTIPSMTPENHSLQSSPIAKVSRPTKMAVGSRLSQQAATRWGWAAGCTIFVSICILLGASGLLMKYEIVFCFGIGFALVSAIITGLSVSNWLSGDSSGGDGRSLAPVALGLAAFAVFAAIIGSWWWFLTADPNRSGLTPLVSCVAITVGGIFAFAMLGAEAKRLCPRCGRLRAALIVTADMLDRHLETNDVLRTDHHYDIWGKPIAKTHRTEQVVTQVSSYAVSRRCKFCHHTWGDVETIRT